MPQKIWAVGEEVLAADFNDYVQEQVVATFPNIAARDTWTSPPDGALCVTLDTNELWQRIAGAWVRQGPGRQVGFQYNTNDAALSGTPVTVLTATFTAQASHVYQVIADVQMGASSNSGTFTLSLVIDGSVAINRQGSWGIGGATVGPTCVVSAVTNPLTAGAHTIQIDGTSSGAGLFYQDGYLTIIDLGVYP